MWVSLQETVYSGSGVTTEVQCCHSHTQRTAWQMWACNISFWNVIIEHIRCAKHCAMLWGWFSEQAVRALNILPGMEVDNKNKKVNYKGGWKSQVPRRKKEKSYVSGLGRSGEWQEAGKILNLNWMFRKSQIWTKTWKSNSFDMRFLLKRQQNPPPLWNLHLSQAPLLLTPPWPWWLCGIEVASVPYDSMASRAECKALSAGRAQAHFTVPWQKTQCGSLLRTLPKDESWLDSPHFTKMTRLHHHIQTADSWHPISIVFHRHL